ncbi:MAG: radical SAM protein [Planctomycetes bacterium]|nr:radical SAM protein [Planctomycetota bacterium]
MSDGPFVPYLVSWNLTRRCNLRCAHCYIDASQAMPDELETDRALAVVAEIAALNPETILILTGGEPLCRPDLDQIVEAASGAGMTVVLGTNGTLLAPARATELARRGLSAVGISLDSLDRGRHDAFRGLAGAWDAARRGLDAARHAGLEVQIQVTLTRQNRSELSNFVQFAELAGARVLTVFFLVCTGRGQDLVDLSPEEYEDALTGLIGLGAGGVMVRPRCAPTFRRILSQRAPDSILLATDAGKCLAGRHYLRIAPDGDVTPCPYIPLSAGSLRDSPLADIWNDAPLFRSLRHGKLAGRCGECEFRYECGGCRARALALSGDPLGEDPWCAHRPDPTLRRPDPAPGAVVEWSDEAAERLARVPFFVRSVVKKVVEAHARREGIERVTAALMQEARRSLRKA